MGGYQGNGTFQFTYLWTNDAANGIPIIASRMDTQFNDAVSGFDDVICRDGQSTTTAPIPFAQGITVGGGTGTLGIYNEGTFVPVDNTGSFTYTNQAGFFTRIGRLVEFNLAVTFAATQASTAQLEIGGLPYNCNSNSISPFSFAVGYTDTSFMLFFYMSPGTSVLLAYTLNGSPVQYQQLQGNTVRICGCYNV